MYDLYYFFAIFLIGNYIYKRLPMTVWLSLCKLYLDFVMCVIAACDHIHASRI